MMREVYVKEIDRRVQYQKLNLGENSELAKIKDIELRGQKMLYMMLHKVDPEITEEQIIEISGGRSCGDTDGYRRRSNFF